MVIASAVQTADALASIINAREAQTPLLACVRKAIELNKCDLLPYVSFDAERFERITRQVNTCARVIRTSAARDDNLEEWYD